MNTAYIHSCIYHFYYYYYYHYHIRDLNINLSSVSSTENEWNHTIKYVKKISNAHIANRLLALNERRWNKENIQLVNVSILYHCIIDYLDNKINPRSYRLIYIEQIPQ